MPHAHAGGHTAGQGDDVLAGTADFTADDVVGGVGPEVGRVHGGLDGLGPAVPCRQTTLAAGCCRATRRRAGPESTPPGLVDLGDLGDDLAHPASGGVLDTFREADEGGIGADQVAPAGQVERSDWDGTPRKTTSAPASASAASLVAVIVSGRMTSGR